MSNHFGKLIPLIFVAIVVFRVIKAARDQAKAAKDQQQQGGGEPVNPWKEWGLDTSPPPIQPVRPESQPAASAPAVPPPVPQARAKISPPPVVATMPARPASAEREEVDAQDGEESVRPLASLASGENAGKVMSQVDAALAAAEAAPTAPPVSVPTPAARPRSARPPQRRRPLFANREELRRAIVMREIIDRPRAFDV